MSELDKQYLETLFYGIRRMTVHLQILGYAVNHKRVQRLLRKMGIEAIYRKPNTSKPTKEHEVYPYLLRGVKITRPNQVWATDITYIPMAKGFMFLIAIVDLYSRKVLNWAISNTMVAEWCTQILKETIEKYGTPEIFNTDQGSQFTAKVFTQVLKDNQVSISMDGKGRAIDNIFVERLWKSVKYEDIYIKSYQNGVDLQEGLEQYFDFYNQRRFHQSLEYQTPDKVYGLAA